MHGTYCSLSLMTHIHHIFKNWDKFTKDCVHCFFRERLYIIVLVYRGICIIMKDVTETFEGEVLMNVIF